MVNGVDASTYSDIETSNPGFEQSVTDLVTAFEASTEMLDYDGEQSTAGAIGEVLASVDLSPDQKTDSVATLIDKAGHATN